MTGRNDPCPCGSGKKYKKCCAANSAMSSSQTAQTTQTLLQQAAEQINNGQWTQAISSMKQLLPQERHNAQLHHMLAVAYYQTGNLSSAAESFSTLVELQPKDGEARTNLAQVLCELGDMETASLHCQKALQLNDKLDNAHNCLGNIYRQAKRLPEASQCYQQAIAINPQNPLYHCNLGVVAQELAQYETAEAALKKALALAPDFIAALNNYAIVLRTLRRYDESVAISQQALQQDKTNPEALNNLGLCALYEKQTEAAQDFFQQAIQAHVDYTESYINLAALHQDNGEYTSALTQIEQALALDGQHSLAHELHGALLFELGEMDRADEAYNQALISNPNNGNAYLGLAEVKLRKSESENAKKLLAKADELIPNTLKTKSLYAKLYEEMQDYHRAEQQWQEIITSEDNDQAGQFGLASLYANIGEYEKAQPLFAELTKSGHMPAHMKWAQMEEHRHNLEQAIGLLEGYEGGDEAAPRKNLMQAMLLVRNKNYTQALQLLDSMALDELSDINLKGDILFEKGKALDKLGQYAHAFNTYEQANTLRATALGGRYGQDKHMSAYYDCFTKAQQQQWTKQTKALSINPIFIVGFPRSGTTLLEQIIASHSQVSAGGELAFISNITSQLPEMGYNYPQDLEKLDSATIDQLRADYIQSAVDNELFDSSDPTICYMTDKMPHNLKHVGLIALLFPESPIIHITRHPLDSCLSAFMSNFTKGHFYKESMESTATHYANLMRLGEHYKKELDLNLLTLRYEELVSDQQAYTKKVLEFIGLDWEDATLRFHESKRVARTASYEQVTKKIYTSSQYRYKQYYEQLKPVFPILQETIEMHGYALENLD